MGWSAWQTLDGVPDGAISYDSFIGPTGELWVLWNTISTSVLTCNIYAADDLSTYDSYFIANLTSYTQTRYCLVVNKNNVAIILYQLGTAGAGAKTMGVTLDRDGTLGTPYELYAQNQVHPIVSLWNGCEDAIIAKPAGGGDTARYDFIPFDPVTGLPGTTLQGPPLLDVGIKWNYNYSSRNMEVDPVTNTAHLVIDGSTDPTGSVGTNPRSIVHIWGSDTSGTGAGWSPQIEAFTPPDQYKSSGTYWPAQVRMSFDRRGNQDIHMIYGFKVSPGGPTNHRLMYSRILGGSGWGGEEWTLLPDNDSPTAASVIVDGKGNVHVALIGPSCPTHHQSNRPNFICAYPGNGAQYYRKLSGASFFSDNTTVVKGFDLCSDGTGSSGPITSFVQPSTYWLARGYPSGARMYLLGRLNYTQAPACSGGQVLTYISYSEDLWGASDLPESGAAPTCEAIDLSQTTEGHTLFAFDNREYEQDDEGSWI